MSGLKHNSKKVLDIIAGQTKQNATQAYKEVHPDANMVTAMTNAHKLMSKPSAQIYLEQHRKKARDTIVELMDSEKDDIRLRASTDVLDREHGKATQRTEVTSTGIVLTIDLTNSLQVEE
jgi:hypothetical protein